MVAQMQEALIFHFCLMRSNAWSLTTAAAFTRLTAQLSWLQVPGNQLWIMDSFPDKAHGLLKQWDVHCGWAHQCATQQETHNLQLVLAILRG